jgi:hypothetical protein
MSRGVFLCILFDFIDSLFRSFALDFFSEDLGFSLLLLLLL